MKNRSAGNRSRRSFCFSMPATLHMNRIATAADPKLLLLDGPMSVEYRAGPDAYERVDSTPEPEGTPSWSRRRKRSDQLGGHYLYFDLPEKLRAMRPDEVGTLAIVDCGAESTSVRTT